MTRYQLAKLVQWAGTLQTRKRLQKTVYLLQQAGVPFCDQFHLHFYGPYSHDLAGTVDEMVTAGLIKEECLGSSYNYSLEPPVEQALEELEKEDYGKKALAELTPFKPLFDELQETDLRVLELASTVVYHRKRGGGAEAAVKATCAFKDEPADSDNTKNAVRLAEKVMTPAE